MTTAHRTLVAPPPPLDRAKVAMTILPLLLGLTGCVSFDTSNPLAADVDGDGYTPFDGDCDDPEDANCDLRPEALDLPYADCVRTYFDPDGRTTTTTVYDSRGYSAEMEEQVDGVPTRRAAIEWDDRYNNTAYALDQDADGDWDEVQTATVEDGVVVRFDVENDGSDGADEIYRYARDEDQHIVRLTLEDASATLLSATDVEWAEADGLIVRTAYADNDGDGSYDAMSQSWLTKDPKGVWSSGFLVVRYEVDEDLDGNVDRIETYQRDHVGRTLESTATEYSSSGRETGVGKDIYSYNELGQLVTVDYTSETATRSEAGQYRYSYECP